MTAEEAYEAYRRVISGPSFHLLPADQREAWKGVADEANGASCIVCKREPAEVCKDCYYI